MINFILITLLLKTLIDFLAGNHPHISLNCGIWGYYGKDSRFLNWDKFNMLGVFNDVRGGDASGIVYGDNYSHDASINKLYVNHSADAVFPVKEGVKCAFGHARKASFGKNMGIQYAQPLIQFDGETIKGMFSHNGTLHNHEELRDELKLPTTFSYPSQDGLHLDHNVNDSWVIFSALQEGRFDILTKYIGGAAFSYYDNRNDLLYLWSGSSKLTAYGNIASEERPLFVSQYKNHIWFSSLEPPLDIIDTKDIAETHKLANNVLCKFKAGKLISTETYDRSDMTQEKPYKEHGSHKSKKKKNKGKSWYNTSNNRDLQLPAKKKIGTEIGKFNFNRSSLLESEQTTHGERVDSPIYKKGRYWANDVLLNGIKHIDMFGSISDFPKCGGKYFETKTYYFFRGILINDHDDYRVVCKMFPREKFFNTIRDHIEKILKYSVYPVQAIGDRCSMIYDRSSNESLFFEGYYRPVFSNREYSFEDGECTSIKVSDKGMATAEDGIFIYHSKRTIHNEEVDTYTEDLDDEFDSQMEEMAKKEISNELANVLIASNTARSIIDSYGGSNSANKAIEVLDNVDILIQNGDLPF